MSQSSPARPNPNQAAQPMAASGMSNGAPTGVLAQEAPTSVLRVQVLGATNLKNLDTGLFGDLSDPYVKVKVGQTEHKTPTINDNLNPVWKDNNLFDFKVGVEDTTLYLKVMNSNYIKDDSLGEAELDLRTMQAGEWCHVRQPLNGGMGGEVDVNVFLKLNEYHRLLLDSMSMLHLHVKGACDLMNLDTGLLGDVSDPYVVAKVGKVQKKTSVIDDNLNPVWHDSNEFTFRVADEDAQLELEVFNANIVKDDSLGLTNVDLRRVQPQQWVAFKEKLRGGGKGELEFSVFFQPTKCYHQLAKLHVAREDLSKHCDDAEVLAKQVKMAEDASEWLEDGEGKAAVRLSLEERDWEAACGGRNLPIPAWIVVTKTEIDSLEAHRAKAPHIVDLFPHSALQRRNSSIRIKIIAGFGLQSMATRSAPNAYCVCEVAGEGRSQIRTPTVPDAADPEWHYSKTVKEYAPSDALRFSVFSDKGSELSRHQRPDELLGQVELPAEQFYPNGFSGMLDLVLANRRTHATIRIMVLVTETA